MSLNFFPPSQHFDFYTRLRRPFFWRSHLRLANIRCFPPFFNENQWGSSFGWREGASCLHLPLPSPFLTSRVPGIVRHDPLLYCNRGPGRLFPLALFSPHADPPVRLRRTSLIPQNVSPHFVSPPPLCSTPYPRGSPRLAAFCGLLPSLKGDRLLSAVITSPDVFLFDPILRPKPTVASADHVGRIHRELYFSSSA